MFGEHLLRHSVDHGFLCAQLAVRTYQRNHNLDVYVDTFFLDVQGSLNDGAGLHLGDFGIGVAQAAATVTQHRVRLGQCVHLVLDYLVGDLHFRCHVAHLLFEVRYEFVQGGVEQAHRYRMAVHRFEQPFEVAALHRQQLGQRFAASLLVVCEDHLADGFDAVAFEEHVFGTAQADALRAEAECGFRIARRVGVRTHLQVRELVGQFHQFGEIAAHFRVFRGYLAFVDHAGRAVERNPVTLFIGLGADGDRAVLVVDH